MACSRQDNSDTRYQFSKMVKNQWEILTETCLMSSGECFAEKVDITCKGYRGALMCSHHHMWISKCSIENHKQKVTLWAWKIWKISWFSISICFFTGCINQGARYVNFLFVCLTQGSNLKEQAQEQEKIKMYATRIVCMDKDWNEMWEDNASCNNGCYHGGLSYITNRNFFKSWLNINFIAHTAATHYK